MPSLETGDGVAHACRCTSSCSRRVYSTYSSRRTPTRRCMADGGSGSRRRDSPPAVSAATPATAACMATSISSRDTTDCAARRSLSGDRRAERLSYRRLGHDAVDHSREGGRRIRREDDCQCDRRLHDVASIAAPRARCPQSDARTHSRLRRCHHRRDSPPTSSSRSSATWTACRSSCRARRSR